MAIERATVPSEAQDFQQSLIPNFASFYGESLMPPSNEGMRLTPQEFQEQYSVRYSIWNTLSQNLTGQATATDLHTTNMHDVGILKDRLHILNQLDRYVYSHQQNDETRTLRGKQITVFENIRNFLEKGGTDGYIKLPTGSGKTVLFTELIEATDIPTLVVVPSNILVDQTGRRFEQFAPDLDYGKINKYSKERGKQVTITTYYSLIAGVKNGTIRPENFKMLVLDEAHKALGTETRAAVEQFKGMTRLGFTATPRFARKELEQLLPTEIHTMTIAEGVEEEMLSSFSAYIAKTSVDLTNVPIQGGDYDKDELEKVVNQYARNKGAVDLYEKMFKEETVVAYCAGVKHAETMAQLFNERGIATAVVHGKQRRKEQETILEKHKNGEIKVICNSDILIEGFDEPRASVCLNLRPTRSPVVAEQRGGRVLRIDENNPDKHAYVVDFLDKDTSGRNGPITFAQIVGQAEIIPPGKRRFGGGGGGGGGRPTFPDIDMEGIEVITDAKEVLRIIKEFILQEYKKAPDDWITIGNGQLHTLTGRLNKSWGWVRGRIDGVLAELKLDQERKNIPPKEQKQYQGEFLDDKQGKVFIYYDPVIFEMLKALSERKNTPPAGWKTLRGKIDTLVETVGKSRSWIKARLPNVIEELEAERQSTDTSTSPEPLFGEYLTIQGILVIFYSPLVEDKLKQIATQGVTPPEGWLAESGLATLLGRTRPWVDKRVPKFLDEFEKARKEANDTSTIKEMPTKEYINVTGRTSTFYHPEIVTKLQELASQDRQPPENWVKSSGKGVTLESVTGRSRKWVSKYLPQAIREAQQAREILRSTKDEEVIPLFDNFLSNSSELIVFYSPEVVQILLEMSEKQGNSR